MNNLDGVMAKLKLTSEKFNAKFLENQNLSLGAKGLLMQFIAKPDNCNLDLDFEITQSSDDEATFYSALQELISQGYFFKRIKSPSLHTGIQYGYFVSEVPLPLEVAKRNKLNAGWKIIVPAS